MIAWMILSVAKVDSVLRVCFKQMIGGDIVDAKSFLSQVKKLDLQIKNKLIEKQQWKDIALGITANMEGERVQSSSPKSKMASAVEKIVDMEAEINALIDKLIDTKKDVIKTIESLDSTCEYQVVHLKYIQDKTFEEIAEEMNRSYSAITTIHGRALVSVQKILDSRK